MSGQWKPGDVGIIGNAPAFYVNQNGDRFWMSPIGTHWRDVDPIRPLVVIDPEDREQVERLVVAHCRGYCCDPAPHQPEEVAIMQAALRSLTEPDRPEEPTGLGAVVEDEDGERYVRHGLPNMGDDMTWCDPIGVARPWSRIKAVRILSKGVPS